jgi:hypothetical protein
MSRRGFALTRQERLPGRARSKPIKHRARDALGLADLRHALPIARTRAKGEAHRTSTSLDVARRRGPRVPLDPWRPARPRFFFRAMRIFPKTTAYPAPQRNRAAERWLRGLFDKLIGTAWWTAQATSSAHSRESGNPALTCIMLSQNWTPAFAGVSGRERLCAGMSGDWGASLQFRFRGGER